MILTATDGASASPGYRLRPAAPEDAARLARQMREADRLEVRAAAGFTPVEALERSLEASARAYAVELSDGAPAALFGVAAFPGTDREAGPRLGAPWLLGSNRLVELSRPFLRRSRDWVAELGRGFDLLVNAVDARNRVHIRWLGWAGFTFLRRVPDYGVERRPFFEFVHLVKGDRHV